MAIRLARVRPLFVIAALGAGALIAPTLAAAAPTAHKPKPTVDSVQRTLGNLSVRNSQLVDQFNSARVEVGRRTHAAAAARASAARAAVAYQVANVAFTRTIQAQYEAGGVGLGGALLDSSSGNDYLDRLDTMSLLSTHNADVVHAVARTRKVAVERAATARTLLAKATAQRDALSTKRDAVDKQIAHYKDLLSTLSAQQRALFQRANNPALKTAAVKDFHVGPTSAAAKRAVEFALNQVGKPYVWGASGPGSYDCSGLTMQAWKHGGVSLPHSAHDQYNYGTHVAVNQLQPGDLVFLYQPIGHVTIYIGNGMMVSAPTSGQNVSVVPLASFMSDYTGATHLR